jgi:nucleoside phosphorylase
MWRPRSDLKWLGAERPIYLHFLDRELSESAGFAPRPAQLRNIFRTLALATGSQLYCGISIIWENNFLDQMNRSLIADLIAADALRPVSYSGSFEDFISSRQSLYRHDAARYPAYFSDDLTVLESMKPALYKHEDTTSSLESYLGGWAASGVKGSSEPQRLPRRIALGALAARESEALTYTYFAPFVTAAASGAGPENAIRRAISLGYASHYLDFANGDILTGISNLSFFDAHLARDFPLSDLSILISFLRLTSLDEIDGRDRRGSGDEWASLLSIRGVGTHGRLTRQFRTLTEGMSVAVKQMTPKISQFGLRNHILSIIGRYAVMSNVPARNQATTFADRLMEAQLIIESFGSRLRRNPHLAQSMEASSLMCSDAQVDVLLVTATLVETRAVISAVEAVSSRRASLYHVENKSYWDLGAVAGASIHLVQTEMGSGGPSGSILTVTETVSFLQPRSVLVIGIGFGVNSRKQKIGDILISQQMLDYELQRVSGSAGATKVVLRGDRVSSSPRLLDRARSSAVTWRESVLRFGLMLSGEKLIDHRGFRDELIDLSGGEAIGGEMEGAGVYAAAHRLKTDWIVVKAICDWADGYKGVRKRERQELAASNAARFLVHTLQMGGMAG